MKRAVKRRIVALSLAAALLLSAMAGCGGKNEAVHRSEGTVPTATEAEDVMNTTAALSIRYYLTARAYLDAFLHYDPATGTCTFADEDGILAHIYFSKSGGTYSVAMEYDMDYGYGRSYGHYSGSKR